MKEELDYKLNDPGEVASSEKEFNKRKNQERIFIFIIVVLSIISITFIILYFKKDKKDQIDNGAKEMNPHFYLYYNIPTSENKFIRNSFINGRENFIEELGDLNNGKD